MTAEAGLSPAKQALLERWKRTGSANLGTATIRRRPAGAAVPLSIRQESGFHERVWSLEDVISAANIFFVARVHGRLDEQALAGALDDLMRRHESLRTTFDKVDDEVVQVIAPEPQNVLQIVRLDELAAVDPAGAEAEVDQRVKAMVDAPFNLRKGPLVRVALFDLGASQVLATTVHHLIADGGSLTVALVELAALYEARTHGRDAGLEPLPVQYGDYTTWLRDWLAGEGWRSDVAYWRPRLQGIEPPDFARVGHPDEGEPGMPSCWRAVQIEPELCGRLHAFCRAEQATMFMALLAGVGAILLRLTGRTDLTVGCEVETRSLPETRNLIGYLANVIVLQPDTAGDPTLRELVHRVREMCLGAYGHAQTPFEKIIEEVFPGADVTTIPLFRVHFMLQPRISAVPLDGLLLEPVEVASDDYWYDLEFQLWQGEDEISGQLKFDPQLFGAATANRIVAALDAFTRALVADADQRLSEVDLGL